MRTHVSIFDSITLVMVIIILLLMIITVVLVFGTHRRVMVEVEEDEFEAAKREAMRRSVGVSINNERELAKTLMHLSRNRIGATFIIEGKTPMLEIEDTGDSFGYGEISSEFLNTLAESSTMNKGAVLIRRDHIVAYNCRMPIYEAQELKQQGAGNRHLGAVGVMLEYPDSVTLVVSGATGKISIFGHLGNETSVDFGLQLRDTDVINGVGEDELVYRLHTLLENVGILGSLNGADIQREIEIANETKEEKRLRIQREKEQERKERQAKQAKQAKQREREEAERGIERMNREREQRKRKAIRRGDKEREREKAEQERLRARKKRFINK